MRYAELLNEMLFRHREEGGNLVIAHRDSIWLLAGFPDEPDEDVLTDIARHTGLGADASSYNLDSFVDEIRDERPDILLGHLNGDTLSVETPTFALNPRSSLLIKKVAHALGVSRVEASEPEDDGDSVEVKHARSELVGRIPDVVYHGTNAGALRRLLRVGISPTHGEGNWSEVGKFVDRVFLTARFGEAAFHANRQARRHHTVPVIVATHLPDRSRIALDYDIGTNLYGAERISQERGYRAARDKLPTMSRDWAERRAQRIQTFSPKTDFTREMGTFAYRGRIPASQFVGIYLPAGGEGAVVSGDPDNNLLITDRAELLRAISMIEDFGFYDPDYRPDEDE